MKKVKIAIIIFCTIFLFLTSCEDLSDEFDIDEDFDERARSEHNIAGKNNNKNTSIGNNKNPNSVNYDNTDISFVTMECRVIEHDENMLLLADINGNESSVYTLSTSNLTNREFDEGSLVRIEYDGDILETFPAKLGTVKSINEINTGFNDLCELYLDVLDDLWEKDKALNSSDITQISVDLSKTRLTDAEKAAVALSFGWDKNITTVHTMTLDELSSNGYLSSGNGTNTPKSFTHWEDGCFFAIEEKDSSGEYSLEFDAFKFRSSLAAYYFSNCTSQMNKNGSWSDYKIGSEMIS